MGPKRKATNADGDVVQPRNAISALQDAIRKDTLERVKEVLDTFDFDQPRADVLAIALRMGASRGRLDAVQYLLDEGADPTATVNGRPLVPLIQAVEACQDRVPQVPIVPRPQQGIAGQVQAQRSTTGIQAGAVTQQAAASQTRQAQLEQERLKQQQLKEERLRQEVDRIRHEDEDRHSILKLLLQHGANPNVVDSKKESKKRTPLMSAKTKAAANLLLEHKADVKAADEDGKTAIMYARHPDVVELLLAHGADITTRDNQQRTALMVSVIEDDAHAIAYILIAHGADIEAADKMGRTILVAAVWRNREAVVERLLAKGVNLSKKDARGRNVLHHYAGDSDRRLEPADGPGPRIFEMLLGKAEDGDLMLRDLRRRTPLHWAAATGNLSAATALLDRPNTPVDPIEHKLKTPLHLVARLAPALDEARDADEIRSDTGSIVDAANAPNVTQRQAEAIRKQQKIREKAKQEELERRTELLRRITGLIAVLLDHKANVNAEAEGGWTPFHVACQEQKVVVVVQKLLGAGANRNLRIHTGKTAFHIACEAGNTKVVEHLLADRETAVSTRDNFGNSPLLGAASAGHKDIVNLLAPWSERSLRDLTKDAKGAAEQFQATVVDFGGYKRGNEVRKVKVYDLLYTDPKTSVASHAPTSTVSSGSTVFRWIHLPANNVTWCQDLLTKRFIEDGAGDGQGFKALKRSFLHQHGGKKWHASYMRPGCQAVPRSTANTSAVAAPRLSFNAAPPSPASSHFSNEHWGPGDEQKRSGSPELGVPDSVRRPDVLRSDTAMPARLGALRVPDDAPDANQSNDLHSANHVQARPRQDRLARRGSFDERQVKTGPEPPQRVVVHNVASPTEHSLYMFAPFLHFETDQQR